MALQQHARMMHGRLTSTFPASVGGRNTFRRFLATVGGGEDAEEAQKAVLAGMEEKTTEANKTITPWMAKEDISPAMKPRRLENPLEVAHISGMPSEHMKRPVVISKQEKHGMQSGTYGTKHWELKYTHRERWNNPLMGYSSSADQFSNIVLRFETAEQAENFAKKQGWKYRIENPSQRADQHGKKSYAYNFLPERMEHKLKVEGRLAGKYEYKHDARKSNFTKFLRFHGDGEIAQHGGEASDFPEQAYDR